jgi:hypothetical protein
VNNSIHLGGPFANYSTIVNGTKSVQSFRLTWWLSGGNWWLQYGSTWVGYYPGTLYDAGGTQSLHTSANLIEFGGETVGANIWVGGTLYGLWPQMGDGYAGYYTNLAAQQNGIYHFPTTGGSAWSSLTAGLDTSAACYYSVVSGTTVSFGGLGGFQPFGIC